MLSMTPHLISGVPSLRVFKARLDASPQGHGGGSKKDKIEGGGRKDDRCLA